MVENVKLKILLDYIDGWKKMAIHFQVASVCLVVSGRDELLRQSSGLHTSIG